ncbi:MAG: hypothetical protein F6K36_27400 [Symploca sp. SIO3C6]|uniref:Uncharacterized protein n=1 Tax=Symploca sp. SIO1C4 TaxID=2607765 RepID=A0A6B3N7B5_9CYAN|nr:hypothetical protein [Symploca sp. SIO3C6]NER27443.1 hypothetical protein [Symploca sp. SIO1C4]NET06470.1 hypothetical protein [Symploca sp. SIO2B6]
MAFLNQYDETICGSSETGATFDGTEAVQSYCLCHNHLLLKLEDPEMRSLATKL